MMKINEKIPSVSIPSYLYKLFSPECPGNEVALKWSDDIVLEEKKEFDENSIEHLCANLFLCVQLIANMLPPDLSLQKTVDKARSQLKSFGVQIDGKTAEISDEELLRLVYLYYNA